MRWVDAWNDLYDIVRERRDMPCLLPDRSVVGVDDCLGWLQDSVYQGYTVHVQEGWIGHRRGVIVRRSKPENCDADAQRT